MARFSMTVSISRQWDSETVAEAEERFKESCDICCNDSRCLWRSCNQCKLQCVHDTVTQYLAEGRSEAV